jgi:hypothetical protein
MFLLIAERLRASSASNSSSGSGVRTESNILVVILVISGTSFYLSCRTYKGARTVLSVWCLGWGLDNWGMVFWFLVGVRDFSLLQCSDWLWGLPSLLCSGHNIHKQLLVLYSLIITLIQKIPSLQLQGQ